MSKIEAKRGLKMKPKLFRKSWIFLNDPRWVVFRKSCFTIVKPWSWRILGSGNQCKSRKTRAKTGYEKGMRNLTKTEPTMSPKRSQKSSSFRKISEKRHTQNGAKKRHRTEPPKRSLSVDLGPPEF